MWRFLLLPCLWGAALTSQAQNEFPKFEVFAGYCFQTVSTPRYVYANLKPPDVENLWYAADSGQRYTHGLATSFSRNFAENFGVSGAFEWQRSAITTVFCPVPSGLGWQSRQVCVEQNQPGSSQFLVGRRFTFRQGRRTHFTHTLFGVSLLSKDGGIPAASGGERAFAMSFGGGMDVALNEHVAVRTFQADFAPTTGFPGWQPHVKLQTGIVFTFGRR